MTEKTEAQKFFESDVGKIVLRNRLASLKLNMPFCKVFGRRLVTFWQGNILGLDIIAFDKFIEPGDNESLNHAVLRRFGQEGLDIINGLLGIENEKEKEKE